MIGGAFELEDEHAIVHDVDDRRSLYRYVMREPDIEDDGAWLAASDEQSITILTDTEALDLALSVAGAVEGVGKHLFNRFHVHTPADPSFESKHPRWPKGTPHGGEFMKVGQHFMSGGKDYRITAVGKGFVHAIETGTKKGVAGQQVSMKSKPDETGQHVLHEAQPSNLGEAGGVGPGTEIVDPTVKGSGPHDPSITKPAGLKVTDEQWARFGKLDQENAVRLQELFGDWTADKAQKIANQTFNDADDSIVSLVHQGFSQQYGSSGGGTLSLENYVSQGEPLSAQKAARLQKAFELQGAYQDVGQWDLYNRLGTPDILLFHTGGKDGGTVASTKEKYQKGGKYGHVKSGQSYAWTPFGWGEKILHAVPFSVRHILMHHKLANHQTQGPNTIPSENEFAIRAKHTYDEADQLIIGVSSATKPSLTPSQKIFLEKITSNGKIATGVEFQQLMNNIKHGAELPVPASPPNVSMDHVGQAAPKFEMPSAEALAYGQDLPKSGAEAQPMSSLDLKPGDYIEGMKGTRYIIVADENTWNGLRYVKITEPSKNYQFESGGSQPFYKLSGHFELPKKKPVPGGIVFDPSMVKPVGGEPLLVSKMKKGDVVEVHGSFFELQSDGNVGGHVQVKKLDTGAFGNLNTDAKLPVLTLGDPPPPPKPPLQQGMIFAHNGEKHVVTKVLNNGGFWSKGPNGKETHAADFLDEGMPGHDYEFYNPGDHDMGAKQKLSTLPPGSVFHGGTGAGAHKPYKVIGPDDSGKQVVVKNLATGQESYVSKNQSVTPLVPKQAEPIPGSEPEAPAAQAAIPSTAATVEELDALPAGTAVKNQNTGASLYKNENGEWSWDKTGTGHISSSAINDTWGEVDVTPPPGYEPPAAQTATGHMVGDVIPQGSDASYFDALPVGTELSNPAAAGKPDVLVKKPNGNWKWKNSNTGDYASDELITTIWANGQAKIEHVPGGGVAPPVGHQPITIGGVEAKVGEFYDAPEVEVLPPGSTVQTEDSTSYEKIIDPEDGTQVWEDEDGEHYDSLPVSSYSYVKIVALPPQPAGPPDVPSEGEQGGVPTQLGNWNIGDHVNGENTDELASLPEGTVLQGKVAPDLYATKQGGKWGQSTKQGELLAGGAHVDHLYGPYSVHSLPGEPGVEPSAPKTPASKNGMPLSTPGLTPEVGDTFKVANGVAGDAYTVTAVHPNGSIGWSAGGGTSTGVLGQHDWASPSMKLTYTGQASAPEPIAPAMAPKSGKYGFVVGAAWNASTHEDAFDEMPVGTVIHGLGDTTLVQEKQPNGKWKTTEHANSPLVGHEYSSHDIGGPYKIESLPPEPLPKPAAGAPSAPSGPGEYAPMSDTVWNVGDKFDHVTKQGITKTWVVNSITPAAGGKQLVHVQKVNPDGSKFGKELAWKASYQQVAKHAAPGASSASEAPAAPSAAKAGQTVNKVGAEVGDIVQGMSGKHYQITEPHTGGGNNATGKVVGVPSYHAGGAGLGSEVNGLSSEGLTHVAPENVPQHVKDFMNPPGTKTPGEPVKDAKQIAVGDHLSQYASKWVVKDIQGDKAVLGKEDGSSFNTSVSALQQAADQSGNGQLKWGEPPSVAPEANKGFAPGDTVNGEKDIPDLPVGTLVTLQNPDPGDPSGWEKVGPSNWKYHEDLKDLSSPSTSKITDEDFGGGDYTIARIPSENAASKPIGTTVASAGNEVEEGDWLQAPNGNVWHMLPGGGADFYKPDGTLEQHDPTLLPDAMDAAKLKYHAPITPKATTEAAPQPAKQEAGFGATGEDAAKLFHKYHKSGSGPTAKTGFKKLSTAMVGDQVEAKGKTYSVVSNHAGQSVLSPDAGGPQIQVPHTHAKGNVHVEKINPNAGFNAAPEPAATPEPAAAKTVTDEAGMDALPTGSEITMKEYAGTKPAMHNVIVKGPNGKWAFKDVLDIQGDTPAQYTLTSKQILDSWNEPHVLRTGAKAAPDIQSSINESAAKIAAQPMSQSAKPGFKVGEAGEPQPGDWLQSTSGNIFSVAQDGGLLKHSLAGMKKKAPSPFGSHAPNDWQYISPEQAQAKLDAMPTFGTKAEAPAPTKAAVPWWAPPEAAAVHTPGSPVTPKALKAGDVFAQGAYQFKVGSLAGVPTVQAVNANGDPLPFTTPIPLKSAKPSDFEGATFLTGPSGSPAPEPQTFSPSAPPPPPVSPELDKAIGDFQASLAKEKELKPGDSVVGKQDAVKALPVGTVLESTDFPGKILTLTKQPDGGWLSDQGSPSHPEYPAGSSFAFKLKSIGGGSSVPEKAPETPPAAPEAAPQGNAGAATLTEAEALKHFHKYHKTGNAKSGTIKKNVKLAGLAVGDKFTDKTGVQWVVQDNTGDYLTAEDTSTGTSFKIPLFHNGFTQPLYGGQA